MDSFAISRIRKLTLRNARELTLGNAGIQIQGCHTPKPLFFPWSLYGRSPSSPHPDTCLLPAAHRSSILLSMALLFNSRIIFVCPLYSLSSNQEGSGQPEARWVDNFHQSRRASTNKFTNVENILGFLWFCGRSSHLSPTSKAKPLHQLTLGLAKLG